MSYPRIIGLTCLAMIAFAGNSLLCRQALKYTAIDPASFTAIRLISGALVLWLLARLKHAAPQGKGNWFIGIRTVCLCGRIFICLCEPARSQRRLAAVWRRAGHHDRLRDLEG